MATQPIFVNKKLFLGRVEEQKQFRAVLNEMLNPPQDEEWPYVFLLYGDGGMGKTSLASRFRDIVREEEPFAGLFQSFWVDWEDERRRSVSLQVGRDHITPEAVLDTLHTVAVRHEMGRYFSKYQTAVKLRGEAEKKAAEALSVSGECDDLAALRSAGADAIAKIVRHSQPLIGETGEKLTKAFLEAGIKVGAEQAAQLRAALENRLRARPLFPRASQDDAR